MSGNKVAIFLLKFLSVRSPNALEAIDKEDRHSNLISF